MTGSSADRADFWNKHSNELIQNTFSVRCVTVYYWRWKAEDIFP